VATPSDARSRLIGLLAWTGGGLFAASLLAFAYHHVVVFARPAPEGRSVVAAIGWNIGLFALFGLHHSSFARARIRGWVATHTAAGAERVLFVWIASLLLIAVCALWRPVPGTSLWTGVAEPWRWLLGLLQACGGVLAVGAASVVGIWQLAGIRPEPVDADGQELRVAGPYRWVRHPIYAGWFLFVFAAWPMTMTQLTFALASGAYTLIGMAFEERSLRASTGGAYDRYRARVRWKLIPGIY
jgi:protein-S-isoprenylcysteine O-methyltransferase Ste14